MGRTWIVLVTLLISLLFVPTTAAATPSHARDIESCTSSKSHYSINKKGIAANKRCSDRHSATSSSVVATDYSATAARPDPHLEHKTVSACFSGQLGNPDFESCREQEANFCPEGSWIRAQTVDTRQPDANPAYGAPKCWTAKASSNGAPPVSIDEVRTLLVLEPEIRSDNGGRGIRNAETNFYADAETRTLVTTLNGVEVELRATPVSFHWDYGDGSPTKTTSVAGQSQPEFNVPTPTSHVYEDTGQYTVRLTTVYIGEYREAGGEWVLIPGTISLDSAPVTANIWRTITRNVADDCSVDSSAWGCTGPIESAPAG